MTGQRRWMRQWATGAACALAWWCGAAGAQTGNGAAAPAVLKQWHVTYDVARDGRASTTYVARNQLLQPGALEGLKSFSFSFSTGIQAAQVLEAYTLKADGRRIEVPSGNYQTETSDGRDGGQPLFSDRTRVSLVFPDVAVGDTVGLSYRIDDKEAIFPGAFSVAHSFSPYTVQEDSRVTVRYAKGLDLRFEAHGLQEQPATTEGDATVRQWRYTNPAPRARDEADAGIWRVEDAPVLLASSFADYEAIARAYGERALPKAEPTPRIRTLARSILGSQTDPRERARLLYEWVSTHITYGGNCIGVGAVVPRDTDLVLDNKMGDCKDHATLLQALLAAADIRSEQVLINAGELYDLPATPVVSTVNHVMNYLPDLRLYVDATAKQVPFGYLPSNGYAKPVIHVGAAQALATTPAGSADQTAQRVHTVLRLNAEGGASGSLRVEFKGTQAARMREYMRDLQGEEEREFVRRVLASAGYKGRGALDKGELAEAQALSDQYGFGISFDIDNYLQGGAQGAFVLAPVLGLPLSVVRFAALDEPVAPRRRVRCYGFHSQETYEIALEPGVAFTRLPDNFKTRNPQLNYSSSYQRTKNGVKVVREIHDTTPEGLCAPEYMAQWNAQARPIARSLQGQIFYKRHATLVRLTPDRNHAKGLAQPAKAKKKKKK